MTTFEAVQLPDEAKRSLCLELLEEFGASVKRINDKKGEITHGCLISPELHRNQDTDPTASLNYRKLTYHCLGCGASGGFLWFIATCRGQETAEAREWLGQAAGLGTLMELEQLLTYLDQLYTRRTPAPLPTYSERLLKPFYHPYLEDRGIPQGTQERFKVGWDPESDRIVLPHFWKGRLVGWQTRALPQPYWSKQPEEVLPKYLSSADFPKDTTIFNYAPGPAGLVVESMMSVLKHAHAFEMVSTFGASITEEQADRLTKYGEITLWLDNDKAGWNCLEGTPRTKQAEAKPGLAEVLSRSVPVWIVESPWSQDPGDLPTEEAHRLATTSRVPWSVWRRPEVLYCWECRNRAHTGPCRP